MKTSKDPRHIKREKAVKTLFSSTFGQKQPQNKLASVVISQQARIDQVITQAATEWPISQINRVDLAILRLAIYEMIIKVKEPPKVIIDEAVELAKKFGSEKSPQFINGVLGTVYQSALKNSHEKK